MENFEKEKVNRPKKGLWQRLAALTAAAAAAEVEHKKLSDYLEKEIDYEVVPIRKLVHIQLCCGLHMAEYLKAHPEKLKSC